MESHPYTKPRGVGPVTTQLTPGAEPASSEVRRRTRPMVLFTNLQSVERILYAIFYRFNQPRVRAVLAARAIPVRAILAARIVGPHPPPFFTSSLTLPRLFL